MNNEHQYFGLFPTPLMITNYLPDQRLVDFLKNQEEHPMFSEERYKYEAYTSGTYSKNIKILKDPKCVDLRRFIIESALKLSSECLGHSLTDLVDTLSWVSHKKPGESHKSHNHPNSYISGVYYFDDVPNNTPIVFERPSSSSNKYEMWFARDPEHNNEFSAENFKIGPKKGDVVLFPSYLMHFVPPNTNQTVRSSLSFNLMPVDSIGEDIVLTTFNYKDSISK